VRWPKPNTIAHLKSKYLASPKFWPGFTTVLYSLWIQLSWIKVQTTSETVREAFKFSLHLLSVLSKLEFHAQAWFSVRMNAKRSILVSTLEQSWHSVLPLICSRNRFTPSLLLLSFLKFTKSCISDLLRQFFYNPKITFCDLIWGRDPVSEALV